LPAGETAGKLSSIVEISKDGKPSGAAAAIGATGFLYCWSNTFVGSKQEATPAWPQISLDQRLGAGKCELRFAFLLFSGLFRETKD